ncbi:tRNA1(Val) A37 N6-methylase TrmN6 [Arthrobacter stackebrandtii]|uniref:tRNA1(Val) A37 N6-methylase TrmN6 n=1 Tax=Arthrobacter stackebrandtii TaxID=272161 RepID=A0ABS4YUJ6_9MICC|nr:methyltransferase [Arthrobacter stackebrandtii]MBP2412394.1 tRNA1(Val) A37 N6-methylase TrmN6 [Arthrobacter stackebrandtii]PYH02167.1 SAM-dependent methyltransferase [Arthrobacter stackebrandtii]
MTDFASVPGAPRSDNLPLLSALAADLAAANFTVDGVAELLGDDANHALGRDQTVPAALLLRGNNDQLATVVKLWLLAQDVPAGDLARALPGTGLKALTDLGLIEPAPTNSPGPTAEADRPAEVRAAVDLRPYGWPAANEQEQDTNLWVASDLGAHQRPGVLRKDHVLGIGQASLTLAQGTVRQPVGRALDLGTGCGIQLFHLLHHAETVVATDISERALAFTRFNLALNAPALRLEAADLDPANPGARVSLRLGSLLEPVADERFDLVVSNPPFVITPRHRGEQSADQFTYRDGGLAGDAIVEQLVRGLPGVLNPGGIAQMLGNWEVTRTETSDGGTHAEWHARPSQWLAPGSEAWFIQREQVSPGGYAETWLQDASQGRDSDAYASAYEDYLLDFASRGVGGIGFGYILLRRPAEGETASDPRFEEILYPIEQPVGPHLADALDRAQWLKAHPDLTFEYLLTATDVTEERHQKPGAEHPGVILLRQGAGLRRTNLMSTELAGFVSACDGDLTAGQIIGALAALLERDDPEFAADLARDVRNLVRDGFLLPSE